MNDDMKYVVLHSHPEGLEMSQQGRDLLFSTGTVLHVRECDTYSLQSEYFRTVTRRPLTVLLWGMADRYGVAQQEGVTAVEVKDWSEAYEHCRRAALQQAAPPQRAEATT